MNVCICFSMLDNIVVPKAASKQLAGEFEAKDYRSQLDLCPDHESRPLWVVSIASACGNVWLSEVLKTWSSTLKILEVE